VEAVNFYGSGGTLKEETESGSELETTNFIRSWKRKQKIPRVRKRKQTRKHDTSRGARSKSKKYSTASTSLVKSVKSHSAVLA